MGNSALCDGCSASRAETNILLMLEEGLSRESGPEMHEAIVKVHSLFALLESDVHHDRFKYPTLLNLATIAGVQNRFGKVLCDHHRPCYHAAMLQDATRWMKFATAAYGEAFSLVNRCGGDARLSDIVELRFTKKVSLSEATDMAYILSKTGLNSTDIVDFDETFHNAVGHVCHYIGLHHDTKSVVLSIRGTESVGDLLTDLMGSSVPFLNGYAHEGIATSATYLFETGRETLRKLLSEWGPRDYKLVIVGHSLGGATAILLTMLIFDDGTLAGSGNLPSLECWSFAPPAPFYPLEAVSVECRKAIRVFVSGHDAVPRFTTWSIWHAAISAKVYDMMPWSLSDRLMIAFGKHTLSPSDAEKIEKRIAEELAACSSHPLKLTIPGTIVCMHEGMAYYAEMENFRKLFLSTRMLDDHMPREYERNLKVACDAPVSI
eukprot:TRINITY_DN2638_c0_g1_i3.p1 TRINITY_DN2638_c0_g1~~TRINITY_DN2638_c0_g1_i3.p1  ORF type:complete len:434 (-),score=25.62 TRINITY_DN2638_c0_g1_i3:160-1461(-)